MEMKEKTFDESIGKEAMKENHDHEEGVKIPIHDGNEEEVLEADRTEESRGAEAAEDEKDHLSKNDQEDTPEEISRQEEEAEDSSQETGQEDREEDESAKSDKGDKDKKNKKKKKKSQGALEIELKKCKEKVDEYADRYQRLLAEFENARTRSAREQSHMYDAGAKDILAKLLPVVDNFERGIEGLSEEEKEDAFAQGIIKIYQQLMTTLEESGVKPMNAKGKEFDPNFHNAVMHEDNEEMGENLVAEEFQKGYMYKEDVLRHAMVKVVN